MDLPTGTAANTVMVMGCFGGFLFLVFVLWRLFMNSLYSLFGRDPPEETVKRHRAACIDCGKPILCEQDDGCVVELPEEDEDDEPRDPGRPVHGT